jgi:hypothetical protein
VNPERLSVHTPRRGERRETLEGGDVFGTAIGIAGVVERVDPDEDVVGTERLRPAERERQEDRIARRDVGGGDIPGIRPPGEAILWYRDVRGERGAADGREVDRDFEMPLHAEPRRDGPRRLELAGMALPVPDGQCMKPEAFFEGDRGGRVGVETAAQEDDCIWHLG